MAGHRAAILFNADLYISDKSRVTLEEVKNIFRDAEEKNIKTVHFGKGIYCLTEWECRETLSIAHDDGCGDIHEKDCHIYLENLENLTLEGECTETGEPATILAGFNSRISQTLLPSVLWAENCKNLTIENLAFTRKPECASSGEIVKIEKGCIFVSVFPGNPCYDKMSAYCMNRFSIKDKALLGESLTYGFGYDRLFSLVGERLLMLEDEALSSKVHVGEGLSWHQAGKTDFQLFFGKCDDLKLKNIRIYNTNSYAVLTENCCNIWAERLVIKPEGDQFFTGPRDGWKIYRCTGDVRIESCVTEGVRMDGQNVHSNFLIAEKIISDKEILAVCRYAPISMREDFEVQFYNHTETETRKCSSWEILGSYFEEPEKEAAEGAAVKREAPHRMTRYRLCFFDKIPPFVKEGTLMSASCWEPQKYFCYRNVYKNIAGAGHLLRCKNVEISDCTYENMMNAGVLIGAEFDTHCEGGHGEDIYIHNCTFRNCGTKERYGKFGRGCISIKSQGFSAPVNKRIKIKNNVFESSDRALEIRDVQNGEISGNQYRNIREDIFAEKETVENVLIEETERKELL